jgi:hypothetical protein
MRFGRIIWLLVAALLAWACDVHEFPTENQYVDITLNVTFDDNLALYREIDYTKAEPKERRMRHTIEAYYATGPATWAIEPDFRTTVYTDGPQDVTVNLKLEPARYRLMVWSDYTDASGSSLYYDPTDFNSIRIPDTAYIGSDPYRDAFAGVKEMDLTQVLEADAHIEETLTMTRPVGKYSIVATDRDAFLKMYISRIKERMMRENVGTKAQEPRVEDIDIDIFKVVVVYTGFLPDTYNMWMQRPTDARTGVQFESRLREMEGGDLELALDYVIVNGEESSVSVGMFIYDDYNEILATIQTNIPLHAGMRTTLTGKFLTSGAASGISIQPGYDGEFNIPL